MFMDDMRKEILEGGIVRKRSIIPEEVAVQVYVTEGVEAIIDKHVQMVVSPAFVIKEMVRAQPRVHLYKGKAEQMDIDYKVVTEDGDLTVEVSIYLMEGDENLRNAYVKVYRNDRDESLIMAQKKFIESLVERELDEW